jgi:dCMP deaminase
MNVEIECPKCGGKLLVDNQVRTFRCTRCSWEFEEPLRGIMEEIDQNSNTLTSPSWDEYFFTICCATALRSKCLSRRLGCVLVEPESHTILSTGYNGPARDVPQCGPERMRKDHVAQHLLEAAAEPVTGNLNDCPRKRLGYSTSEHLDICPAVHAERNCLYNAARVGTSVSGSILYTSDIVPCSKCLSALNQAGVVGVVCIETTYYDRLAAYVAETTDIKIRKYNIDKELLTKIWETSSNMKGE